MESLRSPISTDQTHNTVTSADDSMLLCMKDGPMNCGLRSRHVDRGRGHWHHLSKRLPDAKTPFYFVGFQAEGTKGRLLQEGLSELRIHHEKSFPWRRKFAQLIVYLPTLTNKTF